MRLFIIIISLLVGSTCFAEQIFREDFNNTDSYAPWAVNFSGGASSTYVDIYANYAFLVWYISDSSLAEQVSVSRSFIAEPNTQYTLTANLFSNEGNSMNLPYRILNGNTVLYSGSTTLDFQWNNISLDFSLPIASTTSVTIEFQIGEFNGVGFNWIELNGESDSNGGQDSDGDGLTDDLEINTYSTNPNNTDSDGDGLNDYDEVITYGTNPNNTDSDGDGLTDGAEVTTHSTNPNNTDSDGDGLTDGAEVTEGSDPSDPNSPAANSTNRFELLRSNGTVLFTTLVDGDTIDLNEQGTREFNIRYYPDNNNTVSIEFKINDQTVMIDNQEPYMIGGSGGLWLPKKGSYSISAIERDASNQILVNKSVSFSFVDVLDHRLRNLQIITGNPNDLVEIRMQKHLFPFGSMMKVQAFNQSETYKTTFLQNYNCSVHGNAGKWYSNQPDWWGQSPHNQNYSRPGNWRFNDADNVYNYLNSQGIPMRGHTFFWGMVNNSQQSASNQMWDPDWVEARVNEDPSDGLYWIEQRARKVAQYWSGRIDEWDFNNEMGHGDWYRDTFTNTGPYGLTITKQMVDWALEENPDLKIYHNDYGILNNSSFAVTFKNLISKMKSEGVPIDGVGVQGHFQSIPNKNTVKQSLDILDDFGAPIKITEFDVAISDGNNGSDAPYNTNPTVEQQEADGLEDVYRTAFEHHAVEGIIMWGFWETHHWRPEGALYLSDWTPTPQGLRYRQLVYDEWWTDADLRTNNDGHTTANVFAGDYEITVNGITQSVSIPAGDKTAVLDLSGGSYELTIDTEVKLGLPVNENIYAAMENIEFRADVEGDTNDLLYVEFYLNNDLVKRDYNYPFTAEQIASLGGDLPVEMKAYYVNGDVEISNGVQITIISQSGGANILSNGGFENGLNTWQSFGSDISQITNPKRSGAYACRASNRTLEWNGIKSSLDLRQEISSGTSYQLSCFARLGSGSDSLKLILKSQIDGVSTNYGQLAQVTCNSTEWTELSGEIFVQNVSNLDELFFYISGASPGIDIIIDDVTLTTAPGNNLDIDGDGLQDSWENYYFNSLSSYTGEDDPDGDGSINALEFRISTNPIDSNSYGEDSDGDGINDYDEINNYFSNPNVMDSDGDGLSDGLEINTHNTNPNDTDTDNDTFTDLFEIQQGSNPANSNSIPINDADGDGLSDEQEAILGTNPNDNDTDNDTLGDYDEINIYSTNPLLSDSDNDGLTDDYEVYISSTDPNDSDSDNDGLPDGFEINYGGSINMNATADEDADGYTNFEEWIADTNPTNPLSRLIIFNNLSNPSNVIFSSSSNREYRLEFSTNLLQNLWFETNQWVVGEYSETIITIPLTNEFRVNRIRVRIPEE